MPAANGRCTSSPNCCGSRRPALALALALALVAPAAMPACASSPAPPAYLQAQRLERLRRHDQALAAYRRVGADCQRNGLRFCTLARLRAAEMLEALGRPSEALGAYQQLTSWSRDRVVAARALHRQGRLFERALHDPRRALASYQALILGYPAEVAAEDALRDIVRLHRGPQAAHDLALLLAALYRSVGSSPLGDNLLFRAAELNRRHGKASAALALYDRLAASHPGSALRDDALWQAGQLLERQADWRGAIRRYRRLLAGRKDAFIVGSYNSVYLDDAQLRIGRILLDRLGERDAALDALQTLRDDFPDSVLRDDAQWWIAQAYLRGGHRPHACQALRRLLRDFPDGNHARRAREALAQGC